MSIEMSIHEDLQPEALTPIAGIRRLREDPDAQLRQARQRLGLADKLMQRALTVPGLERKLAAQAVELYGQALALAPDLPEPSLKLAYLSWQMGQPEAAVRLLKSLKLQNPCCAQADQMLARLEIELMAAERQRSLERLSHRALDQRGA